MSRIEATIEPPKPTSELGEGRTLIAIVLYSVLLSPCPSVLFRMLFGAFKRKLESAGVSAEIAGLFGIQYAMCCAEVSEKGAALEAARAFVTELNISDESYIGYYEKAEVAWRIVHCGSTGWNLPFAEFFTQSARSESARLMADENRLLDDIIRLAQAGKPDAGGSQEGNAS